MFTGNNRLTLNYDLLLNSFATFTFLRHSYPCAVVVCPLVFYFQDWLRTWKVFLALSDAMYPLLAEFITSLFDVVSIADQVFER